MNSRVRQAALRIMLLLEEFSAEELAEALALLGKGDERDLPTFLSRLANTSGQRRSGRNGGRGVTPGETKCLQDLKETDPEKYRVLHAFDVQVREGSVLPTLADVRTFGQSLTKTFGPVKSRREGVDHLLVELSALDLNSVRAAIKRALPTPDDATSGLNRFANQLLSTGKQAPSENSTRTE
jgi:hypothetical protein